MKPPSIRTTNGDTLHRRKTSENDFQCGCRWEQAVNVPETFNQGARGDILVICDWHSTWNDHYFTLYQAKNPTHQR